MPAPLDNRHIAAKLSADEEMIMPPTSESLTKQWIEHNPQVMGGTAVIRGTRMTVYSVAGRVAHGDSIDSILEDNPDLCRDAVEAALAFARANPLVGRPGGRPWQA
jgi:uncharacterized protein (DUF433 family)